MTYSFLSLGCQVLHVDNGVVFLKPRLLSCYIIGTVLVLNAKHSIFFKYITDKYAPLHRLSFFYKLEQTLAWLLIELLNFNYTCMHKYIYKIVCIHAHTKKCLYAHWPLALTTAAMSIDQCCHSGRAANICLHLLTFPPFIQT